ncbi:MAG: hypothetical protein U0451_01535 [Candidatus Saccharimonadales bacterium]
MKHKIKHDSSGAVLMWVIGVMVAMGIIISSALSVIHLNLGAAVRNNQSQLAFNISDAGINYYLWHLSHDGSDFKDGNPSATMIASGKYAGFYGPFAHDYKDDNGNVVGKYTLYVKPKSAGSTIATVRSIGTTASGDSTRTIEADLGAPSFAANALTANIAIWFANGEDSNGRVHSNVGIRKEGGFTDEITSSNSTYCVPRQMTDPDYSLGSCNNGGASTIHKGVWCSDSATNCATKTTGNGYGLWRFPAASVDFNKLQADRCKLKLVATADYPSTSGITDCATQTSVAPTAAYIKPDGNCGSNNPNHDNNSDSKNGYLIELTGNTYNRYTVTNEVSTNSTWSTVLTKGAGTNNPIPPSGVIFVEDNVWVRTSSPFTGRVTIVASCQSTSTTNTARIVQADDIEYSAKNGTSVIGLIAQSDFFIAPYAPKVGSWPLKLHAAIITTGAARFPYRYNGNCMTSGTNYWNSASRVLDFYGSVAVNGWRWTWITPSGDAQRAAACGSTSVGIQQNDTNYDNYLLYAPPPKFPVTSTYNILAWREVLTTP